MRLRVFVPWGRNGSACTVETGVASPLDAWPCCLHRPHRFRSPFAIPPRCSSAAWGSGPRTPARSCPRTRPACPVSEWPSRLQGRQSLHRSAGPAPLQHGNASPHAGVLPLHTPPSKPPAGAQAFRRRFLAAARPPPPHLRFEDVLFRRRRGERLLGCVLAPCHAALQPRLEIVHGCLDQAVPNLHGLLALRRAAALEGGGEDDGRRGS